MILSLWTWNMECHVKNHDIINRMPEILLEDLRQSNVLTDVLSYFFIFMTLSRKQRQRRTVEKLDWWRGGWGWGYRGLWGVKRKWVTITWPFLLRGSHALSVGLRTSCPADGILSSFISPASSPLEEIWQEPWVTSVEGAESQLRRKRAIKAVFVFWTR